MKAIILGKRVVGRKETLEYVANKQHWQDVVIGISCFFGFWAWLLARILRKKCVYYCIDYYTPTVSIGKLDDIFIWLSWQMDKFLIKHCDIIWDISERISWGRGFYGSTAFLKAKQTKIVPLSYPPTYFRFKTPKNAKKGVFCGLVPYGFELLEEIDFDWIGKGEIPIKELLELISDYGYGVSLWAKNGNNYYGDPGKTKLYSACGLPVIMTNNTPYAKIIKETMAGIIVDYTKESVKKGIKELIFNYDFYKRNVKLTWKHINADEIFKKDFIS